MTHSKAFIKLKKEIEELTDYDRGLYTSFWLGYVHGIVDYGKYGEMTEEEGMELEDIIKRGEIMEKFALKCFDCNRFFWVDGNMEKNEPVRCSYCSKIIRTRGGK